ncbi:MAG: hypothetical protein IAG10_10245, partial [Planctomycetaceae bacterium]|nr:hypothetical protein [Planctomycetaceae bacterium]
MDVAYTNSNNTLTIEGTSSGDTIVVQKHATNTAFVQVFVNSVQEYAGRLATIGKLVINGGDGADSITVNTALSLPSTIHGNAGNDTI